MKGRFSIMKNKRRRLITAEKASGITQRNLIAQKSFLNTETDLGHSC